MYNISKKVHRWREYGMVCDNWEKLFVYFSNCERCEWCNVKLTKDRYNKKTTRCINYDYDTGLFRNVICMSCNSHLPNHV